MAIVERHQSPDGVLTLTVDVRDGDWIVGLDWLGGGGGGDPPSYCTHMHGETLVAAYGYAGDAKDATRAFVDDILCSRRALTFWRLPDRIRDAGIDWPVDAGELNASLAKYGMPGETWEARFWDGRPAL